LNATASVRTFTFRFSLNEFVRTPTRIAILMFGALALMRTSNASGSSPAQLSPELAAFLASQPKWSTSAAVEAAVGYKDNLLLSHANQERSAFARGGLEFLLLRVPRDQMDYSLFLQADGTKYFSGESIDDESKAWAQTEIGYRVGESWKFSLPLTGYYYDQVFDVSDSEVERNIAELKVTGVMVGPSVRWNFHPSWWAEVQAAGERKSYADSVNDGNVGETALRVGWKRWQRIEARLAGVERWRDFDERAQYTPSGRELVGTHLKIQEHEAEIRFDVQWDADGRWQTVTRAGMLRYRDNGSGYFNYREKKISQELDWNSGKWRLQLGGSARRIDFEVQTVGVGIDLAPRVKDEFTADLRVERRLSQRWTALAGYTWERTRSNDVIASYAVKEGLLGLRWSWEK
jgi:hypothetical protein